MRKYFPLFFVLILSLDLHGQIVSQTRALDNNHGIAIDTTDWKIHRALKEIYLNKSNSGINFSIGGEIRQRTRFSDNINFGDVKPGTNDRDIFWTQRYMLHGDLKLGGNFRIFGQINSSQVVGKDFPGQGIDVDKLSIMQSFVDFRTTGSTVFLLRAGRQDISYGSGMVIGTRDGPNVRQTYDGLFTSLTGNKLKADLFVVRPVKTQGSYFDNKSGENFLVWSSYVTLNNGRPNVFELYYFGSILKNAVFRADTATDNRHSIGGRVSRRSPVLSYAAELTGQFGSFANNRIFAWQAVTEISYRWNNLPLKPRIGSRQLAISGDKNPSDNILNLFRPVSARPPVNEMIFAGSSNIMLVQPTLQLELFRNFSISGSYYAVWRQTTSDGIYTIDLNSNVWENIDGSENKRLFTQGLYGSVDFQPNYHFQFSLVGCLFSAGEFLKATGKGENLMASEIRFAYWF